MLKKLISLSLAALLSFNIIYLTACSNDDEYGDFEDVVITETTDSEGNTPDPQFTPTENKFTYDFAYHNVGRAMLTIPYPKTWTVEKTTDYDIAFRAPSDDPYFPNAVIYFHSDLSIYDNVTDAGDMKALFGADIQNDIFNYEGNRIKINPSSYIEKEVVNTNVSKAEYNYQLSYRDWDASVYTTSGNSLKDTYYHQTTVFSWHKFPCVLTGLVPDKSADQLNDLLLYMMSNIGYINDSLGKTESVTIFENTTKLTFPCSPLYKETSADPGKIADRVVQYACPADSGTGYSHSYLTIYETDKKSFKKLDSETFDETYVDTLLFNTLGITQSNTEVTGFFEPTGGSLVFGKNRVDEYIYRFTIRNAPEHLQGIYDGQPWFIAIYPVEHNGKIDLITLTTTESGSIWSLDVLKLIAKYISYK